MVTKSYKNGKDILDFKVQTRKLKNHTQSKCKAILKKTRNCDSLRDLPNIKGYSNSEPD